VNSIKDRLPSYLWKFALALGLIGLMILVWGKITSSPPATPKTVVELPTTDSQPSVTPVSTQPVSESGLLPTATPTPRPPTLTPTPIPVYHVVQEGEVPLSIAAEYDISVDTLLEINNITDPTRLQIGQQLLIPVTVTPTPALPSPTPTPRVSPTPTPDPVYHVVQAGDMLIDLASEYSTTVEIIMLANDLDNPRTLRVGQELLIPPSDVSFGTPTVVHQVEGGDTVSRLAFLYGSTIEDILAANPDLEPTALQIGQKVIIPVTSPPLNPAANPRLPQITAPDAPPPNLVALQEEMVNAVNAQRQASGLPPYQTDDALVRMALAHAQDMVARGYFAHTTPEGITIGGRFEQQGIDANWSGENIQRNTQPEDETVREAVNWFMNSPPHRNNILHERFNIIGVGVAEGPPGWYTFVLEFAGR
jgi:uncharacterized protein YkwD